MDEIVTTQVVVMGSLWKIAGDRMDVIRDKSHFFFIV